LIVWWLMLVSFPILLPNDNGSSSTDDFFSFSSPPSPPLTTAERSHLIGLHDGSRPNFPAGCG
jgi:hypothetical protein